MKKELNHLLTGASLFIKACMAMFFLVIILVIVYIFASMPSDSFGLATICFGPFLVVFGIFFLIMILWILAEIKKWADENMR